MPTRQINFTTFDVRSKKDRPINCPADIAEGLLHRKGRWDFPVLTGIATHSVIRRDGTLIDQLGYDEPTGLYLPPGGGAVCPTVKLDATHEDAIAAAAYLMLPLREVPFAAEESRSVVLSGILSGIQRIMLDFVPIHAIDAPQAGSGKGLVCNYIAIIVSGHEAPAVGANKDPAETDKAIGAKLIAGHNMILLDNLMHPLESALVAQAMTQGVLDIRVLSQSRNVTVPNRAMWLINGNNLALLGDLPRRALKARLDARTDAPEQRAFESEHPLSVARRDRYTLVAAALTVLVAFRNAGSPKPNTVTPLGSFEQWSTEIRNAIIWLGMPDPVKTQEAIRSVSRTHNSHLALMKAWLAAHFGTADWPPDTATPFMTARELVGIASEVVKEDAGNALSQLVWKYRDLREALLTAAADRHGEKIDALRLAKLFSDKLDVSVADLRIEKSEVMGHGGVAMWRVVKLR